MQDLGPSENHNPQTSSSKDNEEEKLKSQTQDKGPKKWLRVRRKIQEAVSRAANLNRNGQVIKPDTRTGGAKKLYLCDHEQRGEM